MNQEAIQVLFALLRSAIYGTKLTSKEREKYSHDLCNDLAKMCLKHDVVHLLALGLKNNGLISKEETGIEKTIFRAAYRYERLNEEYEKICKALESAEIPFIPLKGAVIRKYYPEAWMRTSCDVDILVSEENSETAANILANEYGYAYQGRASHDISLFAPNGMHLELHFNLVEDGVANESSKVLGTVWETAVICEGYKYWHEMPDDMFYFYHIAHMAKHFEKGGCGIRPFIDLWILDRIKDADQAKRDELLEKGGLLKFAEAARKLSNIWFENAQKDPVSAQMEDYLLNGGVYGTKFNSDMINAAGGESRLGAFLKLVFMSRKNLEKLYPNLKRYPILFPFYQVKRWFRVFNKNKRKKIKNLTDIRSSVTKEHINTTVQLLDHLGLKK